MNDKAQPIKKWGIICWAWDGKEGPGALVEILDGTYEEAYERTQSYVRTANGRIYSISQIFGE